MNYEIHIRDVDALELPMVLEHAEKASIVANWMGGDDKTQPIVGSELVFSMETPDGEDGKYIQFFTNDEQKYLVEKIVSTEQVSEEAAASAGQLLWKGFMLPESYSEPWENPLFYVTLSAVDGIGLLKGKRLSADFYDEEKTPVEVISACLALTGLDYDLLLAPAIENAVVKGWHNYYMDTRKYYDPEKLPSAYELLEDVVHSMRCRLYQCDGSWQLIGINKLHLISVDCYKYSAAGEFLGNVTLTKQVKQVDWSPSPVITMVPSVREVVVTHDTEDVELRVDAYQEQQVEWSYNPGIVMEILPDAWDYNQDYMPIMKGPEYYLELPAVDVSIVDKVQIALKEKPFVRAGWKVKLEITIKVIPTHWYGDIDEWSQPLWFRVYLNDTLKGDSAWSDPYPSLRMVVPKDGDASGSLEFIAEEDGFLDIVMHPPWQEDVESVKVTNLSIDVTGYDESTTHILPVDPKSSVVRDIDLAISDDISGFSNCFYLEKQREFNDVGSFTVQVPILYSFTQNGNNYAVVTLKHAHLVNQFKDYVFYSTRRVFLENLEVIYNFNGGEEMVVKTDDLLTGSMYVRVRTYKPQTGNRADWLRWVDTAFGIEEKPYAEIVADIEKNLFATPHIRIEAVAQAPLKYNDLIKFRYRGEDKYFVITNLSWNPDINESSVTLVEGVYAGNSLGNIPPFVDAGPDIYIEQEATTAQITQAIAQDPDGEITSLVWEHIGEEGSPVITTAGTLNPSISNITGSITPLRLTATDNAGATASDTMRIIRVGDYILVLELINSTDTVPSVLDEATIIKKIREYKLSVVPTIPSEETITLDWTISLELLNLDSGSSYTDYTGVDIIKNGALVVSEYLGEIPRTGTRGDYDSSEFKPRKRDDELVVNGVLNYIASNDIRILIEQRVVVGPDDPLDTHEVVAGIDFTAASFQVASARITNLPYGIEERMHINDYM